MFNDNYDPRSCSCGNDNLYPNMNNTFPQDNYNNMNMMGNIANPVMEPPRENVVYKNIYHEVPHA